MKFKIRFADQIIGFFIILSLVSLVVVIVLLGKSQRWFSKDISFSTILPSAGGLSKNMAVLYRGFTIGNIETFYLTENDDVEVIFIIHEEYRDRVRLGSLVEMMISPVNLGNQFLFHAGRGAELVDGAFVPAVGSAQARELIRQGLAEVPRHDDSITLLMNRASTALDDLGRILDEVETALITGSDSTEIGKIVGSIRKTIAGAEDVPGTLDKTIMTLNNTIEGITAELAPILANVDGITTELNDPDNLLFTVLDTDKAVYTGLVNSLNSLSAILDNLERTTDFIPSQLPQLAGLLMELRVTVGTAQDVLVSLTNNPLLRRGIPEKAGGQGSAAGGPRDIQF